MVISEKDKETYAEQGFLILRQAFTKTRIKALLEGIERLIDKGLAGECELGWIDRDPSVCQVPHRPLAQPRQVPPRLRQLDRRGSRTPSRSPSLRPRSAPQPVRHARQRRREALHPKMAPRPRQTGRRRRKPAYLRRHEGTFVQFNAPLVAGDRFLNIVPGSHLRASTAAEIEASRSESGDMPNAHVVALEPGDIAYYNANLWHRGWNPEGHKRWTMHCAFWSAGATGDGARVRTARAANPAGASGTNAPHYAAVHPRATSTTIQREIRPPCSTCSHAQFESARGGSYCKEYPSYS